MIQPSENTSEAKLHLLSFGISGAQNQRFGAKARAPFMYGW